MYDERRSLTASEDLTLKENVAEILINVVLSEKFKPGDRFNESELGCQLRISRVPIREALRQNTVAPD